MKNGKTSYNVYKIVHYIEHALTQRNRKGLYSDFDLVLLTTLLFR